MFTGARGLALLVVILLHVLVGYAFYSGLANRLVQTIIPPVENRTDRQTERRR